MKRRIVLHIGLSKTGTTNIQRVLSRSRNTLAAQGVLYPNVAGLGPVDARLAPSLLRPQRPEPSHIALALELRKEKNDQPELNSATPLWSATFDQIENSGARTTIISYENFYHQPDRYSFCLIADRLRDFHVHGIIYLRPLEDWMLSLYSQMVKGNGRLNRDFSKYYSSHNHITRLSEIVDAALEKLPLDSLSIGDFYMAAAEDLIRDFMKKSELTTAGVKVGRTDAKTIFSLPNWATLFLLSCNRGRLPDHAFLETRNALYRSLRKPWPSLRPGLDVATPEERRTLRDIDAADAHRLWRRHGVRLTQKAREPVAFRPFDDEDFRSIRAAIESELPPTVGSALDRINRA
jgi:hypothetical protein